MTHVHSALRWSRSEGSDAAHFPHRLARRADRAAVAKLTSDARRSVDPRFDPAISYPTRVVEVDGQIVGWMRFVSRTKLPSFPMEPWGEIEDIPWPPRPTEPFHISASQSLHLVDIGWLDVPALKTTLLNETALELAQLHGHEFAIHRTSPPSWATHSDLLPPAAYTQQLHSGPIDDPIVTPMLEAGWRLDGRLPSAQTDAPVLVLRWHNPVFR